MGSDSNGDWLLNYWEFKQFYLKLRPNTQFLMKQTEEKWKLMFDIFDKNKDRIVTWEEAWYLIGK